MIESLLKFVSNDDLHVKTIVKPRYIKYISHPHYASLQEGYAQVNENKEYFLGPFLPEASHNLIRINHYYSRDLEFYKTNKLMRVHVSGTKEITQEYIEEILQNAIEAA